MLRFLITVPSRSHAALLKRIRLSSLFCIFLRSALQKRGIRLQRNCSHTYTLWLQGMLTFSCHYAANGVWSILNTQVTRTR